MLAKETRPAFPQKEEVYELLLLVVEPIKIAGKKEGAVQLNGTT